MVDSKAPSQPDIGWWHACHEFKALNEEIKPYRDAVQTREELEVDLLSQSNHALSEENRRLRQENAKLTMMLASALSELDKFKSNRKSFFSFLKRSSTINREPQGEYRK